MKKREITILVEELDSIAELSQNEHDLAEAALEAANTAWAPYSNFKVGAAVLLDNGEIVTGSNQENAAYPSGLCAERVAIFSAHAQFPGSKILSLAVCAKKGDALIPNPVSPCCSCRQVISESNQRAGSPMKVIMIGENDIQVVSNSNMLLPLSCDNKIL